MGHDTTGWVSAGDVAPGYEYKMCFEYLSWWDAQEVCRVDNAELASIHSVEENDWIVENIL